MRRTQRGVAAVELAILLPILILLAFGITEYGRAVYQYDTLTKSARSAARYLSQYAAGDTAKIAEAKCLAVYGASACGTKALLPELDLDMVTVCDSSNCPSHSNQPAGTVGVDLVTVTIEQYPFESLVPGVVPDITFGNISVTMRQAL